MTIMTTMKNTFLLPMIFVGLALSSCGTKHANCRELFDKHYEKNIAAYMATMPQTDSVVAQKEAEYALNKLYEIDSTFVLKEGEERDAFVNAHKQVIEAGCDSIRDFYNCRKHFERYCEKNISILVRVAKGADTVLARKKAERMFNRLYEIDSTFTFKEGEDLQEFMKSNLHIIKQASEGI